MEPGSDSGRRHPGKSDEREAAERLAGDRQKRMRRMWRSIPSAPRCKMCHRPFAGIGGPVMRLIGLGRWPGNPKYCRGCFRDLYRKRAGAEIECSLLFADVRGSTALAERMGAMDYRELLERFYATAFDVLVAHDAFVDKFVGDEVIGIFLPVLTDGPHARQALEAGIELLQATGHGDGEPWVQIGIGINAGTAYVGAVGTAEHVEFTALGDVVNVAARLSSAAAPGELLATQAAVRAADLDGEGHEHRSLALKGKADPTDVVVFSVDALPRATDRPAGRAGT